jgi:hypothetical protein
MSGFRGEIGADADLIPAPAHLLCMGTGMTFDRGIVRPREMISPSSSTSRRKTENHSSIDSTSALGGVLESVYPMA